MPFSTSTSFTSFATGHVHTFGGTYVELVPHERIRHTDRFDDPNLPGEMCYLGWQESLALLALLVEAEIPAP